MENKELYQPFPNKTKSKFKYFVYVMRNGKKKKVGFGHKDYQHFKDKLGHYSNLDHNDPERRKKYLSRAKGIKNKKGELTWKNKNYANYYAVKFLW